MQQFEKKSDILQQWEDILSNGEYGVYSLNEEFYGKLKKKAEDLANKKAELSTSQNATLLNRISKINDELTLLDEIRAYFTSKNLPFDLVIISLKKFKSNIDKKSLLVQNKKSGNPLLIFCGIILFFTLGNNHVSRSRIHKQGCNRINTFG